MSTEQEPKKSGKGTAKNTKATEGVDPKSLAPVEPFTPEATPESIVAEPTAPAMTGLSKLGVVNDRLHPTAGKLYAAFLRGNPAYTGVVPPPWGPAAKKLATVFIEYAYDTNNLPLFDTALEIFCSAVSANPHYSSMVPEGLFRASFAHAKSVHDACNAATNA